MKITDMYKAEKCPHDGKCLLIKKAFDNDCDICRMCRDKTPDEYAVHVKHQDGISEAYRFCELPTVTLGSNVDHVTIYCLAEKPYYSQEVISFQPSTANEKSALYALVSTWS